MDEQIQNKSNANKQDVRDAITVIEPLINVYPRLIGHMRE